MAEVNRTYVHFPGTSRVPAGREKKYAECLLWHLLDRNYIISPFFFHPFPPIFSSSTFRNVFFSVAHVRACMRVWARARPCARCVCLYGIFDPVVTLQAPAHTTSVTVSTTSPQFSAYKFHCCALKDRHVFLSLSSLSLSLSVTPFLLPSLYICQAVFCQSSPHGFFAVPALFRLEQRWREKRFLNIEAFYAQLIFHFSVHVYFVDKSSND